MFRIPLNCTIVLLIFCGALASCGGRGSSVGSGGPPGTGPVVLAMTDTPPTNVTILSAEVTLTGATLSPGNVSLLAAPTTLELTRLQTDVAYLSKTSVKAGSYTSLALTFANPSLTIENDTTSVIGTCAIGAICTIPPTTTANLSTTITLPTLTVSSSTGAGLLVDLNLENLLSSVPSSLLGADFKAGTTVSEFTPAGSGAPLVGAEDVVGQVASVDTVHNTFSFAAQSSLPPPSLPALTVDNTSTFFNFPTGTCATPSISCLKNAQIVSVDISIRADGTAVARNVVFEDNDSSKTEVEGIITSTNTASKQFTIVSLAESAAFGGPVFGGTPAALGVGELATVTYTLSTTFDLDFTHADNVQVDTSCCQFQSAGQLSVGQQVQVRSTTNTPGNSFTADRVQLRSSRITATVQSISAPNIFLGNVPSIFSGNAITQIQAQTSAPTIFSENGNPINISMIPVSGVLSVRGPLFNVGTARTLVATKVVFKP